MKVVELTGARGVGKSTLAACLRAEFARRKVPLNVDRRPILTERVVSNIAVAPARLRMERLWRAWNLDAYEDMRVFKRRFRHYQLRRRRYTQESGIYLLEEGLFQLMLMIHIRTGREIGLIARSLSELVPMPDVVISVEATEEAIDARRRQRGNAGDLLKPKMSARGREGIRGMRAYLRKLSNGARTRAIIVENAQYSKLESIAEDVVEEVLGSNRGQSPATPQASLPSAPSLSE